MKNDAVPEKEHGMSKRKKLIIAIVLAACLALCVIAALLFMRPGITGVESLIKANVKAQSKVKSYHVDGKVNMDIALDYEDLQFIMGFLDLKLAVEMDMSADAGTETAHVVTDAGVTIFGETVAAQTAELYLDMKDLAVYSRTGDSRQWKKSGDHADQFGFKELAGGLVIAEKTIIDNAEFNETDEYYTLTLPAEKAGELVTGLHLLDRIDLGFADVRDITVESGQIVYYVDKKTLLVSSVEFNDVDCRGKGDYQGFSVDLKFTVNGEFTFSRYNELEESEFAIPAEVKETK